jgi:hypothetical protein
MLFSRARSPEVRRERTLYALGAGGVALHTADHLVSAPQRTLLFVGAVALAAFTIGLVPGYPWLTVRAREVAGFVLGAIWASAALVHHVFGLFVGGVAPTDFTGIAAAIGGGLILCAGLEARHHRVRTP